MGRRSRSTLPPRVYQVRRGIEHWRRQRSKRSPMPAELWAAAVSLARSHGVGPIARALRIDYGALKKRVTARLKGDEKTGKISTEFIELTSAPLLGPAEAAGMVVELWDGNGARLLVRLGAGNGASAERSAEGFRNRRG
jgi:hypothetical protein